jgi:hypothetical protein
MNLATERERFEASKRIYESAKLKFAGVDGYDVYNPSIPFRWQGKTYMFGRVERRGEWARSWVRLFERSDGDEWTLVPDSMIYQLEDPYVSFIGDTLVFGGTHVRYESGKLKSFCAYFYRGTDLNDMYYFTTGPDNMKDIRLIRLADGRVGVFSRPRSEAIRKQYGSEAMIGFTVVDSLDDLTAEAIEQAPYIHGLFGPDEWGGCNQAYLLDTGYVGVIGHKSYRSNAAGRELLSYVNISFVFDPGTREVADVKIIGTRSCYPPGPSKLPELADCAFTAGIVMREDGKVDLYSGIGDCEVGRIVIDYPFEGYGRIVEPAGMRQTESV